MLNIIKSDLYRLFRSKGFYIAIAVVIVISMLSIITMQAGSVGIQSSIDTGNYDVQAEQMTELSQAKSVKEFRSIMRKFGNYDLDNDIIGQNANLYYVFIIIVVIVITKDFSNKSIKNTLSSAISRKKYYLSKLLLVLGLSTVIILFNTYFTYFMNLAINGKDFTSSFGDITKVTIYQLPMIYGIITLLVCFAFLFRKTSLFNAISIPFLMLCQLLTMVITGMFKIKADILTTYDFQVVLNTLVHNPSNSMLLKCSILGIAYILVFALIGYYSFRKVEIK